MKVTPSPSPRNELEIELVKLFVLPEKQERLLFLQGHRRNEFVKAFHTEKYLNPAITTRITHPADVLAIMKQRGASNECYAVSSMRELDAKTLPLSEALKMCVGFSIETVLISPNTRVGYFEGGGYTERYVLVGNAG